MREVLSIHVGQAGIQLGTSLWELYCHEHCVSPEGKLQGDPDLLQTEGFSSFFRETSGGSFTPMCFMVDLEPTVIDAVKTGPYRSFFHSYQMVHGKEDAANNFARGFFSVGGNIIELVQDRLQNITENCDSLQGLILFHSVGGGTGSGFASLLVDLLGAELPKKTKLEVAIHPAPKVSSTVVEPYNCVLTAHSTMNALDCSFIADNEAMYDICTSKLDIDLPSYDNLNRIVAQAISSVTASIRFQGPLNVDFIEFQTNLVPFPRIHYPVISYAPIIGNKTFLRETATVTDITKACFDTANQLVKCDLKSGKYVACCLLYRGDVAPKEINAAISLVKNKKMARFVEWSPTGFKVGINSQPPSVVPGGDLTTINRSCCMISNTTAVTDIWTRLNYKFSLMYAKKAFLHWYLSEGLEEDDIRGAIYDVASLEMDYEQMDKEDITPT